MVNAANAAIPSHDNRPRFTRESVRKKFLRMREKFCLDYHHHVPSSASGEEKTGNPEPPFPASDLLAEEDPLYVSSLMFEILVAEETQKLDGELDLKRKKGILNEGKEAMRRAVAQVERRISSSGSSDASENAGCPRREKKSPKAHLVDELLSAASKAAKGLEHLQANLEQTRSMVEQSRALQEAWRHEDTRRAEERDKLNAEREDLRIKAITDASKEDSAVMAKAMENIMKQQQNLIAKMLLRQPE